MKLPNRGPLSVDLIIFIFHRFTNENTRNKQPDGLDVFTKPEIRVLTYQEGRERMSRYPPTSHTELTGMFLAHFRLGTTLFSNRPPTFNSYGIDRAVKSTRASEDKIMAIKKRMAQLFETEASHSTQGLFPSHQSPLIIGTCNGEYQPLPPGLQFSAQCRAACLGEHQRSEREKQPRSPAGRMDEWQYLYVQSVDRK